MAKKYKKIVIITAPSGAGKTSITRYLLEVFPELAFSVSATTRSPRHDEQNGKDYYFITENDFQQKIRQEEFIEWEMVYEGKYYGTLKSELTRIWGMNQIPVLDIDVKGAIHVQGEYPNNIMTLFIEPPSIVELKRRLESRGTESGDSLEARLNKAAYELTFKHSFSKTIMNIDLHEAQRQAEAAVREFINS
jgi:guanylate kinase